MGPETLPFPIPFRPWLIQDRAPAPTPERRWQKSKWYNEIPDAVLRAFEPAATPVGLRDWRFARRVAALGATLEMLSDAELAARADHVRAVLLRDGLSDHATAEAFSLIREATARVLGFRHHPVQIIGARHILKGRLVEMATGEGKTATTALAAVTAALAGVRVHVVTVNEYLCARDFETLAPIYARLGLEAGLVEPDAEPADKQAAYAAAITHVSNKTLVFDYLRARVGRDGAQTRIRAAARRITGVDPSPELIPPALGFAIVDEADSVLIDEAQTPLIIAAPDDTRSAADCETALDLATRLAPERDFLLLPAKRRVDLTDAGRSAIAQAVGDTGGVWAIPRAREELLTHAISATHLYTRDQHYVVTDGKVQIVDEFTGRILEDRQWQAGLHQMVEVKEGLETTAARKTLAQITFQQFFRRYLWFGGMTGTAREISREVRHVYRPRTVRVPTHHRSKRRHFRTLLYGSENAKWTAVARRARDIAARGRPVLIGTRSVDASEALAARLVEAGIAHSLLNARQDAEEAAIIASAGMPSRITIATNMAGRGTDIALDPQAHTAGGLHVILTEFHESARIDRQLQGRSARQGDPGSTEAIVSLNDDVFVRYAPLVRGTVQRVFLNRSGALPGTIAALLRVLAQRRAGAIARRNRVGVLKRTEKLQSMLGFARRDV
ncbi:MAG: hypothetical protein AAF638_07205 [Pseudomonadota bacterium]